jgi:sirohydrochlorin cobaltochelatase
VEASFLELAEPRLGDCLSRLHHEGCREITVLPLLVARGHHLSMELPGLLRDAQARHPGLRISLSPHLGADAAIVDLILARAAQAQALPFEVRHS